MSQRKRVFQYAPLLAERDGGWICHYCNCQLIENFACIPDSEIQIEIIDGETCYLFSTETANRIATVDHVVPKSRDGSDELSNLVLCCRRCNTLKGIKPYNDFIRSIRSRNQG